MSHFGHSAILYPFSSWPHLSAFSTFSMTAGRVVNKLGLEEDNQNFLLMYSISVNVSGQIASVLAGGLILTLMA